MDYLVFRLYGAMASWGEIAVGQSRHSAVYPGKSALLGLVAAALGIPRVDEVAQLALHNGYVTAVKQLSNGRLLRDYHTTQAPDSAGKVQYRTRRDELVRGKARLGTILSSREYRCDALCIVALRALELAPYTLAQIKKSLLKPKYHLYLGRKSCPLSAPLCPQILEATEFKVALDDYRMKPLTAKTQHNDDTLGLAKNQLTQYFWEGGDVDFSSAKDFDPQQVQTLIRHDQVRSRVRWQFSPKPTRYYQTED